MKTWASRWQTSYVRIRKSLCPRRMLASFCRGPHTAQSTIRAVYELPHHAFQPCCASVSMVNSINGSGEISEGMATVLSGPNEGKIHALLCLYSWLAMGELPPTWPSK